MWIRRAPATLSARVGGASRAWAAAAAGGAVLVVVLTIQTDIVHIVPQRYAPVVRLGVLIAAAIAGAVTVHQVLEALFQRGSHRGSLAAVRGVASWVSYGLLALFLTSALGVNLSGFILGSAVLGVIVGAAAQSSLANLFAGLVISLARPYRVGDWVHLRSTSSSGVEADGVVLQIGAMYTTLLSMGQQLTVPNAVAMTAIGRTDSVPVRSAVTLTLPGHVGVARLERTLTEALGLDGDDRVEVWPRALVTTGEGSLTCDIEVRSRRPIAAGEVVNVARRAAADREARAEPALSR
ncbi:MAG TPA: mechanosensitive ion channel family protein [Candidatus Dormibacteraeota bacterium]|nr:mechanosensitive ion channel family protein [Candidatus Dormibacteraeota bacterium]